MDVSSPSADRLFVCLLVCFFPPYSSVETMLEDSENVLLWLSMVSSCELRRSCFFVLWSYSPPLPVFPNLWPLDLFHVIVADRPPPILPLHSIRLEYGCVVVDTCTVWLVSRCCPAVICSSSDVEQPLSQWKTDQGKGWPRFPILKKKKKEPFVPISHPLLPWRNCLDFHRNTFAGISLWIPDPSCMYLHCKICM